MSGKKFYSPKELIEALSISGPTIARRLRDGSIPYTKLGRRVLIPSEFVDGLTAQANYRTITSKSKA